MPQQIDRPPKRGLPLDRWRLHAFHDRAWRALAEGRLGRRHQSSARPRRLRSQQATNLQAGGDIPAQARAADGITDLIGRLGGRAAGAVENTKRLADGVEARIDEEPARRGFCSGSRGLPAPG